MKCDIIHTCGHKVEHEVTGGRKARRTYRKRARGIACPACVKQAAKHQRAMLKEMTATLDLIEHELAREVEGITTRVRYDYPGEGGTRYMLSRAVGRQFTGTVTQLFRLSGGHARITSAHRALSNSEYLGVEDTSGKGMGTIRISDHFMRQSEGQQIRNMLRSAKMEVACTVQQARLTSRNFLREMFEKEERGF